jgi:peroxiredoxin
MKNLSKLFIAIAILTATAAFTIFEPVKGLQAGEKAPLFTAKDSKGKKVSLEKMLKKGSVVVIFYRGFWCPYCSKQLKNMQDSLSIIIQKGSSLVAITPEVDKNIEKSSKQANANFPIIHDSNGKIMTDYKTIFDVNDEVDKKMKGYGIDLAENNGDAGKNLPVPAVYIIGQDGLIKWAFYDEDYRKRPAISDILKNL